MQQRDDRGELAHRTHGTAEPAFANAHGFFGFFGAFEETAKGP